jgi:uncharacterized membrane protein YdbT with pleckstrin-like domain
MSEETTVWSESAQMRDIFYNPLVVLPVLLFFGARVAGYLDFIPWIAMAIFAAAGAIIVGAIYLERRFTRYTLTSQRLKIEKGILTKKVDDVELYRVRDSRSDQSLIGRLLGIGNVVVATGDVTGTLNIDNVTDPRGKREQIRNMAEAAKRERNIRVLQE